MFEKMGYSYGGGPRRSIDSRAPMRLCTPAPACPCMGARFILRRGAGLPCLDLPGMLRAALRGSGGVWRAPCGPELGAWLDVAGHGLRLAMTYLAIRI